MLKDEQAYDTTGRVRTQVFYDYKLEKKTKYFFDSAGIKHSEHEEYFDKSFNVYKVCMLLGTDTGANCINWKIEFDKMGRESKCTILGSAPKMVVEYNYQKNGLLSYIETKGPRPGIERYTYDYWQ